MYGSLLHRVCADPWSALRSAVMVLVLACSMGFDAAAAEAGADTARDKRRDHWAFKAPGRPEVPVVDVDTGARTPIDRFILQRLRQERLKPSPEADRITLLRRLSMDLTGLPPTVSEVDAFVKDTAPDAYAKQVERLLGSKHFGERWARLWLDAARYADSNGYEKDRAREMWYYRDWVIDAFNADMPYDQFLIEQFAGDLLPGATQSQRVATGFLRNSMINEEGAIDPEQFRMDSLFDRMDCIGKSVLGLTIQCAQCHTHKYDPMTHEEYYRLFAFINNDEELTTAVYGPEDLRKIQSIHDELSEIDRAWQVAHPDWEQRLREWEATVGVPDAGWQVLTPQEYGDPGGLSKLALQKDGSLLAGGHRFSGGTWRIKARTASTNIGSIQLELFTNGNLPLMGPGRSREGGFALREIRLKAAPMDQPTNTVAFGFRNATAEYSAPQSPAGEVVKDKDFNGPVRFAIDGNERTAWTIDAGPGRRNVGRAAVFNLSTNIQFQAGAELTIELVQHDELACFRLSVHSQSGLEVDAVPRAIREILQTPRSGRTASQAQALFRHWTARSPEFAEARSKSEAVWKRYPEVRDTALVLYPRSESRDTRLLRRGDWLKPMETVTPGVPAFLNPLPQDAPMNRLTFARWLASPESPTTARVMVNRLWQTLFGTGLVATSEDFGVQGEKPSHPELLDWLASEFMRPMERVPGAETSLAMAWSVKHVLRWMVHSAVYRQQSVVTPAAYEVDPYNRLMARGARFRVDGELVRDMALRASDLLNPAVGGPSIYAPAPAFLFEPPTSYMSFPWKDAMGPDRYRRALYTFRRRSTPYPMLQTFDTPNGDAACVRRLRSNTPLQALTSLNEPLFVESAQALARRALESGGKTDSERITHAFRRVLSRAPKVVELKQLLGLLQRQQHYISEGWVNALELGTGKSEVPAALPEGATPAQLAAYTVVSRVLLNLDEAITRE